MGFEGNGLVGREMTGEGSRKWRSRAKIRKNQKGGMIIWFVVVSLSRLDEA